MERGEIRWFTFNSPDKTRPVLILSRNLAVRRLSEVVVAPVTTTVRQIDSHVLLTPADGMPQTCVVNLDNIVTVPQSRVGPIIAKLSLGKMDEVRNALLFALGFND